MNKKVVWIVNEYCVPKENLMRRQTIISNLLEEKNYDVYIVCGSHMHGTETNVLSKEKEFARVDTKYSKFIVVRTGDYRGNSVKRVLVAIEFQKRLWKIRKHLPNPDLIISNFAGLFGRVFLKWKRIYNTTLIFDVLDLWPETFIDMGILNKNSFISKILYNMEYKTYRNADGLIFSFEGGKDYLRDKGWLKETGGKIDSSKIRYINNGINLSLIDENLRQFIYEDADLDDNDKFKVVYIGSISAANDLGILVETATFLQEKNIDDVMILVYGDGSCRKQLEDLAKKRGLCNIRFKGRTDIKYAPSILKRSDLNFLNFVDIPLLKYGLSNNKLFVYLSSGKPVLSAIRPNYDLVEGRNCGIVSERNPKDIAENILRFKDMDNNEYKQYCENSRMVAEEFDYKLLIQRLFDLIEES